jgi:hypothetical protein
MLVKKKKTNEKVSIFFKKIYVIHFDIYDATNVAETIFDYQ